MKKIFFLTYFISIYSFGQNFFALPIRIAQTYGFDTCTGVGCYHTGYDYIGQVGEPIYSIGDGYVVYKESTNSSDHGMGNNLMIEHTLPNGTKIYSTYSHMNEISSWISLGTLILKGDIIGTLGGSAYGNLSYYSVGNKHLHFETRLPTVTCSPSGITSDKKTFCGPSTDDSGITIINARGYTITSPINYGYLNPSNYLSVERYKTFNIQFGQTIYAGSVSNPQNLQITFKVPEWAKNEPITLNSISNLRIGTVNLSNAIISKFESLNNTWFTFELDLPLNGNWQNGQNYDINFDIATSIETINAYGYQQVKFTSGAFADIPDVLFRNRMRNAALRGLIGGIQGNNFGQTYDLMTLETAARLIVNAGIKFRKLTNNVAGLYNFSNQIIEALPKSDPAYQNLQILKNWGYSTPTSPLPLVTSAGYVTLEQVSYMIQAAFGITSTTSNNSFLIANEISLPANCNTSTSSLKNKYLLYSFEGRENPESIIPCELSSSSLTTKTALISIILNAYEYKYQVNNNQIAPRNQRISAIKEFQIIGSKKIPTSTPSGSTLPQFTDPPVTMTAGQQRTFAFPDVTIDGQPVSCYWSVDGGTLQQQGSAPYFQSIKWTAPSVSTPTTFHLYRYATTAGGYASESVRDIVVNPATPNITITTNKSAICAGENITLSATNCSGTVNWKSGNVSLGTGTSKTLYPTESRSYYATCTINNVESERSNYENVGVTTKPTAPVLIAYPETIDAGLSSFIDVDSSPCDGGLGVISWDNGLGTGFSKTVNPTQTTVYKATCTINGCTSPADSVTVTVNTGCIKPKIQLQGDAVIFSPPQEWTVAFNVIEGTLPIQVQFEGQTYQITGTGIGIPRTPLVSTNYKIQSVSNSCGSGTWTGRALMKVQTPCQTNKPTMGTTGTEICYGGTTTITASGCNGTIKWYKNEYEEYGEQLLGTGTSLFTSHLYQTTYFYASCTDNTGCESERAGRRVFVREIYDNPVIIAIPSTPINAGTQVNLRNISTSAECYGNTNWYKDGVFLQYSRNLYVSPTQTTTYEARCVSYSLCIGNPVYITVFVNDNCQTPTSSISGNYTIENGQSQIIPITLTGSVPYSFTFNGTNYTGIETSPYNISVSPTSNTTYSISNLSNSCGNGTSSGSVAVNVLTVVNPPLISSTVSEVCAGQPVTISASNCSSTVNWSNGLGSGNSKTIYPTTTKTYTAYCSSNGANSGNSNEVTIIVTPMPEAPVIYTDKSTIKSGSEITLSVNNCNGTVNWAGGLGSTNTLQVSPTNTTTYTATCIENGCVSNETSIIITTINCSDNMTTGLLTPGDYRAININSASNSPSKVRLLGENSITLLPGFSAGRDEVFTAKIEACDKTFVLMYPFNGNAKDESESDNHGIVEGSAALSTGVKGEANGAYCLDGLNDYINTPLQQNNVTSYSISAWVKTHINQGYGGGKFYYIAQTRGENNNGGKSLSLGYKADSGQWFYALDTDGIIIGKGLQLTNDNQWIHIAGVWSSSTGSAVIPSQFTLYINGVKQTTANDINFNGIGGMPVTAPLNGLGTTKIGYGEAWNTYFQGCIDNVRIYNSQALSDADILAIYNQEKPTATTIGQVLYMPFNGNANDESGNGNHGTVNGATLDIDRFGNVGKAYSFNGVDNWIEVPHSSTLNCQKVTISAWVQPNDWYQGICKANYVLTKGWDSEQNYGLYYYGNTPDACTSNIQNVGIQGWGGTQWVRTASTPNSIKQSLWFHTVGVYDGISIKLYLNGVLVSNTPFTGNLAPNNQNLFIGRNATGNPLSNGYPYFVNGIIDDVRIYNRALSDIEIQQLYNSEKPLAPTDGLVAYYPFSSNSNDESGNNRTLTNTNATLTTDRKGQANSAYYFNGSAKLVSDNVSYLNNTSFSINFWMKPDEYNTLMAIRMGEPAFNAALHIMYRDANTFTFAFYANDYDVTNFKKDGQWHHYSLIYDKDLGIKKIFEDGVLLGSAPCTIPLYANNTPLRIGQTWDGQSSSFKGKLDDVRIYTRALSDAEVSQIYNTEK